MNLDDFTFSSSTDSPAAISSSPSAEDQESTSSNAVATAIPIKSSRKLSGPQSIPDFPPASAPFRPQQREERAEFAYVQRHVRKTSIDERRVSVVLEFARRGPADGEFASLENDRPISRPRFRRLEVSPCPWAQTSRPTPA